jgi:parallel beta-helix repeat protein
MNAMRRCGRTALLAGTVLALVATPTVAQAKPSAAIACGAVLTSSIVLTRDLTNCPGDGLVVGADGITVDLGGHAVSGDGAQGTSSIDAGVRVTGRHGVTVRNGKVSAFDRGVAVTDSDHVRVERITGSGMPRSGILLVNSTYSVITGNSLSGNDGGVYLWTDSSHNLVTGNHAWGNEQGITVDGARDNTVAANLVERNAGNIILIGDRNLITGNAVKNAVGCGDECGYGISLESGSGNRIVSNLVSGNLLDGIRISNFFPDAAADGNLVRGNLVTGSTRDGIAEGTEGERATTGTVILDNLVYANAGTGIHVRGLGAQISADTAVGNGGHGIDAVDGTLDGGHNRAAGNRTSPQCVGVLCTRP